MAFPTELPRFLVNDWMLLQNKWTQMYFRQHWFYWKKHADFYIRLRIWVVPNDLQDH